MRKIYLLLFAVCFAAVTNAQVAVTVTNPTNTTPNLAASYTSLALAVTDINLITAMSGPVVLTCAAGTETAPLGGYSINNPLGTSSTNTITITTSGLVTITAFTPQTVASTFDAIFKIVGADWITIQNFTMNENAGNTVVTPIASNTMTEFGVLLVHASATDGAQNNTIQNNIITLNSTYTNSVGIFSTSASSSANAALDATSTAGTNSNNKIYGNSISNVAYGIGFICTPITATIFEAGNDIGGTSGATANTITFGNAVALSGAWNRAQSTIQAGIFLRNAAGNSVRFNSITSNSAAYVGSGGLNGVLINSGTTPAGVTYTSTVSDNTVTLTTTGIALVTGIDFGHGINTGTIVGSNNSVTINQTSSAANSAAIIGIKANYVTATNTCNTNTIIVNQSNSAAATTSAVTGITCAGVGTTVNVQNNPITIKQAISGAGSFGSGAINYVDVTAASGTVNVTGNTFNTTGSTIRSTGALQCITVGSSQVAVLDNRKNNTAVIDRVAASGTFAFSFTSGTPSEPADTISNNNISFTSISGTSSSAGIITASGGASATGTSKNINNNTISVTGTNTGAVVGILNNFSFGKNSGNSITINTASTSLTGINHGSSTGIFEVSNNTISLTTSSVAAATITGITCLNTGGGIYTISSNTLTSLSSTGGGAAVPTITGINLSGGTNGVLFSSVTGNIFTSLASSGAAPTGATTINGIAVTSGFRNDVFSNFITNISTVATTATAIINALTISGGTTNNIFKNKISDVSTTATGASSLVSGIRITGGTSTNNVYNNLIGNLTATAVPSTDAIRGINITSVSTATQNIYYNTVHLNASGPATFGTTGIFHAASATSTVSTLNLRNNIIVNNSTPAGAGLVTCFRRSAAATLGNYGATSNNNDFYTTTGSVMHDGTTAFTIATFKAAVTPRDGASFSEDPTFQSTTGSSVNFLKYDITTAKQIESGAVNIAGITDDYLGTVRFGNPGYIACVPASTGADIGAWELCGIAADLTGPVISYTALPNTVCLTEPAFTATITDATGVNTTSGTKPRFWYRKGTNANVLPGTNDNTTDGWKYVEGTNVGNLYTFVIDYTLLFGGVPATGDVINYFVVAQDIVAIPNLSINTGTFAATPPTVALNAGAFPVTLNNTYTILSPIATSITIGGGAATYPTLSGVGGFFADLNTKGLSGNTTVTIMDPAIAETGAIALNQIAYGCAGAYTITIKPNAGLTTVLSGSAAGALIDLNGADNVIFDGSNAGTSSKDMTISNTNTAGTTFRFINDATNNTIKNTIIQGVNTSATSGSILFSTSTGTLGNSTNTINNCDIRDGATLPANGVYSNGTSSALNGTNTIQDCNVFNFTNTGILVSATGAGNGWVIDPTSFYETAAVTTAITGISIQGGSGHTILNNFFGGTAPSAGGTNLVTSSQFTGIRLAVGTASATSVQGNTIKNIRGTYSGFTASYGIIVTAGLVNVGNVTGNYIGSAAVGERIEINGDSYGINFTSTSNCNISNNTINNMTTSPLVPTGEYYFGIYIGGVGAHTITNNTVMNFTNTSTPDGSFNTQTIALDVFATGAQTVRGNVIHDIGSTGAAGISANLVNRVWGLIASGTGVGTVVEKNYIYNLYGSSTGTGTLSDVVTGLQSQTIANGTYSNNMVSVSDQSGSSGRAIFGILDLSAAPAISNYYFNTVSVYGTATTTNSTYAFNRNSTATVTIKDNIFSNTRTGGTGFHVAIANTNAAATGWAATASNYNDLYSSTPTTVAQWLGSAAGNNRDLTGWQASQGAGTPGSGGDANSRSVLPNFVSATDLHLVPATNCQLDGYGTPIAGITTDFDAQTRDVAAPDMGADEFTSVPTTTLAATAGGGQVCSNATVDALGRIYKDASCNAIAKVVPSGATPVSGMINACVTIDATVQFYGPSPYLQRHFDIQPAVNPTTVTGRITLYALQSEFDAYNLVATGFPLLPTGPGDAAGIANVRVTQYNGTGTNPSNYIGARLLINPADVDIVWNATNNWWEISFNVTGFGGFYIHTTFSSGPLPITINYFNGSKQGSTHLLNWKVTCNASPSATMILERSADSRNFTGINTVVADAVRCNQPFSYIDAQPLPGMNYYRLKMVDVDGKISYSGIVALLNATKGFDIISIAPNPVVTGSFKLNVTSAQSSKMDITIIDMQGRLVSKQTVSLIAGFTSLNMEVGNLAAGTYTIQGSIADEKTRVIRFVKQ